MFDKKKKQSDTAEVSLEGLNKIFGDMTTAINDLPNQVSAAVSRSLQEAIESEANKKAPAPKQTEAKEPTPLTQEELEKMDRSQFATALLERFEYALDKKLESINEGVTKATTTSERNRLEAKFEKAREQYADFDEWAKEMQNLVKDKKLNLEPEELYLLARSKDPEKAKELDTKYNEDKGDEDNEDESKDKPSNKAILSLLPTNSSQSGDEDEDGEPKYKTPKEAAAASFDEVMSEFPAELFEATG